MLVTPIAYTTVLPLNMLVAGYHTHEEPSEAPADELAEFAGRNCYLSFNRPNPATATNEGYLANILRQGHESVLEHASVTFYVEDASRSFLAELTRHRHLSFSVVSQRYVDAADLNPVLPPAVDDLEGMDWPIVESLIQQHHQQSLELYAELVKIFEQTGKKRKEAREAARSVLPNSVESPMVVTGNLRAWRDVLRKRYHVAADREIREFATLVLEHLREIAPNSVQDFPERPFGEDA